MKVLVTGGTGFIGSHAVPALLAAGHGVRLLARRPERVERALSARGVALADVVWGDVTDAAGVRDALAGCDAVLHAAGAVALGGGAAAVAANAAGDRNVLGGAAERGLDPILYVSSVAALLPPAGAVIRVDDPVVGLRGAYGRSKAEGERYARSLQARGAPLVALYPAGVYGPHDPHLGDAAKGLRDRLRYGWLLTTGGTSIVDVRDLARIAAAALEPGRGPRRYMAGGHFLSWAQEADLCEELTGRRLRRVPAPALAVRAAGRLVDLVKRVAPAFDYPLTHEAALFLTGFVPCDSRATTAELGVAFRPARETLRDAIRWLVEAGHLEARFAGRLAGSGA